MANLAAKGRGGDTMMAHVTPGEVMIPPQLQTPDIKKVLADLFSNHGKSIEQYQVGSGKDSVNPNTGHPEYSWWTSIRDALEGAATLAGNYFLPGSSLLTDQLVSKGAQNFLNSPYGQIANLASGAIGGGFGSDITGIPQSAGGAFESNALSNFADQTGLSSLYGGTAAPSSDLTSLYNDVNSATPNLQATAGATSPVDFAPGGASASYAAGAAAPGSSGVGGGTLAGFGNNPLSIGEPSFIGSAQGGALPSFETGAGIGAPAPSSGIFSSTPPTGQFNFDISGSPAGASSYSIPQQFSNASGAGGSPMDLSSIFGGGGASTGATGPNYNNMLGGVLKGGLGYLLNNNNASGEKALTNAAGAAQANYQPFYQAGVGAENTLANLYGNNGTTAQTAAQQNFQTSPGYQFALNQGLNAINADAATKGQTLSGNTMEGINNYAQGTAAQQYNNYINQLQNLASGGMSAAGGMGTAGLAGGAARAQLGQNNANNANTAIGTGLSALFPGNSVDWSKIFSGGGNQQNGLLSLFG